MTSIVGEGHLRISQGVIVVALMAVTGWAYSSIEASFSDNVRQDAVAQDHAANVAHLIAERDREMDTMKGDIRDLRADLRELGKSCGK